MDLERMRRAAGIPTLYVSHDQLEAVEMSDRSAVMNDRQVHQVASPVEVDADRRQRLSSRSRAASARVVAALWSSGG